MIPLSVAIPVALVALAVFALLVWRGYRRDLAASYTTSAQGE